ncbi:MAG TPA: two-component system response regulator [Flavobacteriales bacterium]|jgi:CheY-like chemotaxis protein|nr:two-component system response regulator [Flavobacteriales bacterium]
MSEQAIILWADDEIELLNTHVLFLESKGYQVITATSGDEAIEVLDHSQVDIVFLDENMPGITGLETLSRIKKNHPSLPVVMITKSEEESIMEEAIGSMISDYLIKPVNPNQILLALKKNLDTSRLVSQSTSMAYQKEFMELSNQIHRAENFQDWTQLYRDLVSWELRLEKLNDQGMFEILGTQKTEANKAFADFIEKNYVNWLYNGDGPVMSHTLMEDLIFPEVGRGEALFVVLIENLRYDQWRAIEPLVSQHFRPAEEEIYMSILPTATSFSRNAIFSGLLPTEMENKFGKLWFQEEEEKYVPPEDFLSELVEMAGYDFKFNCLRINKVEEGKKLVDQVNNMMQADLNVIQYSFVDTLSHAKTDMDIIKELADDEAAFRSLTQSWFEHSPLYEAIKRIAERGGRLAIVSDHGSIKVKEASKVVGDRSVNSNLRYKQGKNLQFEAKQVLDYPKPDQLYLPKPNVSTRYIFAKEDYFFVYPNNYNHFAQYYKNTFQHGGISLEEMLVPCAIYNSR